MNSKISLNKLFEKYKLWVIKNPNVITDIETVATWSSYFVAGKINNSYIVSEFVYCLSKLLSLFNDTLIREAYSNENHYSLQEQIKMYLTILDYCAVFVELTVRRNWGSRSKWTVVTVMQIFKCLASLMLLYRFKTLPIPHPPIPALQRKKFIENKDADENKDYFKLKRSGRIIRCVDGAPPVALRDWHALKLNNSHFKEAPQMQDLIYAETVYILKPILHLLAMGVFSRNSWKQWFISLSLDLASLKIYSKHMDKLSYEQKLEISRRKLCLILYVLRSPMYNSCSKNAIEIFFKSTFMKVPALSFICRPIMQHLNHWQKIYFYMWAL